MVTYKLEPGHELFPNQWVVVAVFRNRIEWEVGRYSQKWKAERRIENIESMRKAEAIGD